MEKLESSLVGMQNDAVWCKLKSKAFDAKLRKQTELPYDSTTPLLGICPKDLNIELGQIFAAMFTAVLFTRARRWKQPKLLWTGEWIYMVFYPHNGIQLGNKKERTIDTQHE